MQPVNINFDYFFGDEMCFRDVMIIIISMKGNEGFKSEACTFKYDRDAGIEEYTSPR